MKRAPGLLSLILLLGAAISARAQQSPFYFFPDTISFGTVTVGQSASNTVFAYYSDDFPIIVSATSDNPNFTVSPASRAVGSDGESFTVRFQPMTGGLHTGIITFSTDNDGEIEVLGQVLVDGQGFAPFSVTPTTLKFDPLLVGSSSSKTFRILVNPQSEILDLTVVSSHPSNFSVTPAEFLGLEAGVPGIVTVTFNPTAAGIVRGAIRVTGGGATISVVVEGEGVAFQLSTAQLDLGGALVGCSTSRDFTITTGGLFDFQVVPTSQGPFTVAPSSFSTDMPTDVTTTFSPVAGGQAQGVLRIFARSSGQIVQTQDLPVLGVGTQPFADPGSLDFGDTPAGTTSPQRSVVIMSNPPASFQGSFSASSNNPAFQVVSTNTSGRVDVVFSPQSEGPASGTITVEVATQSDSECTASVQVPVQGNGTGALLTLDPTTLDFGMQPVGQVSAPREVTVSNDSNISFSGIVSSDDPAFRIGAISQGAVPQTSVSVPAGGSASIPISFQPTEEGLATATITFEFQGTAPGSSGPITLVRTVSARGEGTAASLSYFVVRAGEPATVSPGAAVDFGPTVVGSSNSVEFEVRNEGETPATIDIITVSNAPVFTTDAPSPATIAPGSALTFTLTFQPAAFSASSGALQVDSSVFTLEGSGVLGGAEITGVGGTIPANDQPRVGVRLSGPTPEQISGTLTMTYTPASGLQPDPGVQFETGGTSASFTIEAGSQAAVFSSGDTIGFQSGTVAASFVFTASLSSGETDITPSPEPAQSGSVAGGAPSISRVSVESVTASGFTVVVEGFSPTREITQATFNLTGRSGIQVQPASVTPSGIAQAFQGWYGSADSLAFGSMFTLTVPFTISGETNAIASVSATVANSQGTSQAVSASLP